MRTQLWAFALVSVTALADLPVGSIQRHRFVAASDDGRRVALLLTHFGPSSKAPFANLVVKEVGRAEPLWQDNRFLVDGGEEQLKMMADVLVKESQGKLADLGLKQGHVREAVVTWVPESAKTAGTVDLKRELTVAPFAFAEEDELSCKDNRRGKRWRVCLAETCQQVKSGDDCDTRAVTLRNIYRTKDAHWFVVHRKIPVLDAMNAFVVDFVGVPNPRK